MFWITCSRCLMLIVNTSNHKQLVRTTASLNLCAGCGWQECVCVCVCVCVREMFSVLSSGSYG